MNQFKLLKLSLLALAFNLSLNVGFNDSKPLGIEVSSVEAQVQVVAPIVKPLWKRCLIWIGGVCVGTGTFVVTDEVIEAILPPDCAGNVGQAIGGANGYCGSLTPVNPTGCFAAEYCKVYCNLPGGATAACNTQRTLFGSCTCPAPGYVPPAPGPGPDEEQQEDDNAEDAQEG